MRHLRKDHSQPPSGHADSAPGQAELEAIVADLESKAREWGITGGMNDLPDNFNEFAVQTLVAGVNRRDDGRTTPAALQSMADDLLRRAAACEAAPPVVEDADAPCAGGSGAAGKGRRAIATGLGAALLLSVAAVATAATRGTVADVRPSWVLTVGLVGAVGAVLAATALVRHLKAARRQAEPAARRATASNPDREQAARLRDEASELGRRLIEEIEHRRRTDFWVSTQTARLVVLYQEYRSRARAAAFRLHEGENHA